MTIASSTNIVEITSGSSINITNLGIQDSSQVKITKVSATGVETVLTLTTHYTINAGLNTVTLLTALVTDERAIASLNIAKTQGTNLVAGTGVDVEAIEESLDKLSLIAKEHEEKIERAFKLSISDDSGAEPTLPVLEASKYLKVNSDGEGFEWAAGTVDFVPEDFLIDEDDLASNSTTKAPTQSSVKAYIDDISNVYNDENAQDAIGGILVDSSTIDFTYNDGVPSITASVIDSSITNAKLADADLIDIASKYTAPTTTVGASLKLSEGTNNGSNFIGLKAPNTLAGDVTFTLPSADGTANQVIKTDGSGNLSFTAPGGDNKLLMESIPYVSGSHYPVATSHLYNTPGGVATSSLTSALIYYIPFIAKQNVTIDRLGVDQTAASGTTTMRLGIYSDNSGKPGTLLSSGSYSNTSTTSLDTYVTLSQSLTKGTLYWAAIRKHDQTRTVRCNLNPEAIILPSGVNGNIGWGYRESYATDGLPATATPGTNYADYFNHGAPAAIYFRVA